MFKKIAVAAFCLSTLFTAQALAAGQITVLVDGRAVAADVQPILEQGRVLIPLRVVMEELGAEVSFDDSTKTVQVTQTGTLLRLPIGGKSAQLNGSPVQLDVPAKVSGGRTLVPLRFVSQVLGCAVDWQDSSKTVAITSPQTEQPAQVEAEVFRLVNQTRREKGLPALVWLDELADLGRAHSQDMAVNNFFSHTSPRLGSPLQRAEAAGLPGTAENIAAGYESAAEIFQAWMASPTHRANILDPENRFMGVGFFREGDPRDPYQGVYCTQEFIKGETFLLSPACNDSVSSKSLTLKGYALEEQVTVTVYKMVDQSTYSEKYSAEFQVANGTFQGPISLKEGKGLYAIQVSDYDLRFLTYR